MKGMWIGIVLVLGVRLLEGQLYDPSKYSLGSNLVQNFNFKLPAVSSWTIYSGSIPSWTCSPNCEVQNSTYLCITYSSYCGSNWQQFLDLNSNNTYSTISQIVEISVAGKYLVHFEWLRPVASPLGKQAEVRINGTIIKTVTVNSSSFLLNIQEVLVELPAGNSTLSFQQIGTPSTLSGIFISNVKMQELLPIQDSSLHALTEYLFWNNVTNKLNSLPGSRIYFYSILNYLSSFDRLQFYYFHRQNLSYYSERILSSINRMALQRGSLVQNIVDNCDNSFCATINHAFQVMLEKLDHQKNYTHPDFLRKNQNGIGFFANNLEFFFFELPGIILIYVVLSLAFRLLFNYRISKLVRKYAFYAILLLVICEGNVEQFAFYFFSQCRLLYSATVYHKIGRSFMLIFFCFVLNFAVGGLVLFVVYYQKLVKYFMEDSKKITLRAILLESLEKSIFPLLFGAVHALFIDDLFAQTVILGIVEACYFLTKLYVLRSDVASSAFKVVLMSVSSLLRLVLIITLYLYEKQGLPLVINLIHHDIVWLYIICWAVQSFHDVVSSLADIGKIIFQELTGKSDEEKQKESKKKSRKTRSVNKGGESSSKGKKKKEKGESSSRKKDKAQKKQCSPISEQVDGKKSKEKGSSRKKVCIEVDRKKSKEKDPSRKKDKSQNKQASPIYDFVVRKDSQEKGPSANKQKSPQTYKSGKLNKNQQLKGERKNAIRIKQNDLNIGEGNIVFRFQEPAKDHQRKAKRQKVKKGAQEE